MSDEVTKKRFSLKGWWWKLPLALIGLIGVLDAMGSFAPAGLPTCDSANARDTLTKAFDNSQFARNLGLSAIQISAAKETGGAPEKRRDCTAVVSMNNAQTVVVDYTMALQDDGQYMLTFRVRE